MTNANMDDMANDVSLYGKCEVERKRIKRMVEIMEKVGDNDTIEIALNSYAATGIENVITDVNTILPASDFKVLIPALNKRLAMLSNIMNEIQAKYNLITKG